MEKIRGQESLDLSWDSSTYDPLLRLLRDEEAEEGNEEELEEDVNDETLVEEPIKAEEHSDAARVNIEEEAMYIREGPLLWPRKEFMDREKIPRTRISFIAGERFNHFDWHPLLKTYIPFGCDLSGMQLLTLRGIDFLWFLAYLDASQNLLKTHALGQLVHLRNLIALKVDKNQIENIILPYTLGELMYLDASYNLIETIPPREVPTLATLRLDANRIRRPTNIVKRFFPKLMFLSVCHNLIESLNWPWSNNLVHLYLSYNRIYNIEGLEGLYKLRSLHLRGNFIINVANLSTDLVSLQYLNLRENDIDAMGCLKHLASYEYLEELIVTDNPFTDNPATKDIYMYKILQWLPKLTRINKQEITEEMREKAEKIDLLGSDLMEEEGAIEEELLRLGAEDSDDNTDGDNV